MIKLNEFTPANLELAFRDRLFPSIISWNRLEGSPRTHNFDQALRAEVRDALWMLTKQWQMGELNGEDAGTPVEAKIQIKTSQIDNFALGNNDFQSLIHEVPLETVVEQQKFSMNRQGHRMHIDIRLSLGNYWCKLLRANQLNSYYNQFLGLYGFKLPERTREHDYIYAHKDEFKQWKAVEGRCIDGYDLLLSLQEDRNKILTAINFSASEVTKFHEIADNFISWYQNTYYQSIVDENNAWLPDRLEYKFACQAIEENQDLILSAEEYYHGHLDWYAMNLKIENSKLQKPTSKTADSFIPSPINVDGMPDKRWWKFENGKTNFNNIKPNTTDVSKLMMIEFGLTYANDWFIMPFDLPIGGIAEIQSLMVKNNFGDAYWIRPVEASNKSEQDWSLFRQTSDLSNNKLFLCPSALFVQESDAYEEVNLIRDEISNMVWAVENTVPMTIGRGAKGGEHALQTRSYHASFVNSNQSALVPYVADIYYNAMTEVPENWIPFMPVHLNNRKRQIQLQRSSMLRVLEGDAELPQKVKPKTSILRDGLDTNSPKPYYLHEDEVPRSGILINKKFARTRWTNGEILVWLATKKQTGKGEGYSGLTFDSISLSRK